MRFFFELQIICISILFETKNLGDSKRRPPFFEDQCHSLRIQKHLILTLADTQLKTVFLRKFLIWDINLWKWKIRPMHFFEFFLWKVRKFWSLIDFQYLNKIFWTQNHDNKKFYEKTFRCTNNIINYFFWENLKISKFYFVRSFFKLQIICISVLFETKNLGGSKRRPPFFEDQYHSLQIQKHLILIPADTQLKTVFLGKFFI